MLEKQDKISLKELDNVALTKLISSWEKVITACVFIIIGAIIYGVVVIGSFGGKNEGSVWVILFSLLGLLHILSVVGIFLRKNWGRRLGQFVCFSLLFAFPIGTIFGAIGLIGLDGAKLLFGPSAFTVKEIKSEYYSRNA